MQQTWRVASGCSCCPAELCCSPAARLRWHGSTTARSSPACRSTPVRIGMGSSWPSSSLASPRRMPISRALAAASAMSASTTTGCQHCMRPRRVSPHGARITTTAGRIVRWAISQRGMPVEWDGKVRDRIATKCCIASCQLPDRCVSELDRLCV